MQTLVPSFAESDCLRDVRTDARSASGDGGVELRGMDGVGAVIEVENRVEILLRAVGCVRGAG